MAIQTTERLYTAAQAAAYLGISLDAFRKHFSRDSIHYFERVGPAYLFAESELDRFASERRPRGNPAFSRKK